MPKNGAMTTDLTDSQIIDALGGTGKTAKLFGIQPASVSEWRKTGIPDARMMYIRLARPDIFSKKPQPQRKRRMRAVALPSPS